MITDLKIIPENDIAVTYIKDGVEKSLKFSEISEYWDYTDSGEEPSTKFWAAKNMIYGIMTVECDQDGVFLAYDTDTEQVVHVSDGAYGIDFDIADGYFYLLCYVYNFMTKGHFVVLRTEFGVKDAAIEGDVIPCDLPDSEDPSSATISADGNMLSLQIDGKNYRVEL